MKKYMTEKEAWEFLARKWKNTTNRGRYTHYGVCASVLKLYGDGPITSHTRESMIAKIHRYGAAKQLVTYWFFWPCHTKIGNKNRYQMCIALAKES